MKKKLVVMLLAVVLVLGLIPSGAFAREARERTSPREAGATRNPGREPRSPEAEAPESIAEAVSAPPSVVEAAPPVVAELLADPASVDEVDEDEYLEIMNVFAEVTGGLLDVVYELIDAVFYIEEDDDLEEWAVIFIELFDAVEELYDAVELMLDFAPEEYLEPHVFLLFAVAFIYDAMEAFESAVDSLFEGDEEAFYAGLIEFETNMFTADIMYMFAITTYEEFINDFVNSFEELMEAVGLLLGLAEKLEDEDDVIEWALLFFEIQDVVFVSFFTLLAIEELVPEEYEDAHASISAAVYFVSEALEAFEEAVDALLEDDEAAFAAAVEAFVMLLVIADELWAEAVE